MTQQDILDALNAWLATFPGLPDVAWEGIDYEVINGRPYLSPRLSSFVFVRTGAGIAGVGQYDGTYTITVKRPAVEGRQPAGQVAGALRDHFGRGAVVTAADGTPIILVQSAEGLASYYGPWASIPVVVTFTANR